MRHACAAVISSVFLLLFAAAICLSSWDRPPVRLLGRGLEGLDWRGVAAPDLEPAAAVRSLGLKSVPSTTDVFLNGPVAPSKDRCLRFVHIPKTGGTSFEEAMETARRADPRNPALGGWGKYDKRLSCTRQVPNPEKWRKVCALGSEGPGQACNAYHTPPRYDPMVAKGYDGCDTFCVVRHPVDRIVSEWQFKKGNICELGKFEAFLREHLTARAANKFHDDCHWLPQSDYVFSLGRKTGLPIRTCTHILKYEHLDEEFPKLMAGYGLNVSLPAKHSKGHTPCNFKISDDLLLAIRSVFAEEFGVLGYE